MTKGDFLPKNFLISKNFWFQIKHQRSSKLATESSQSLIQKVAKSQNLAKTQNYRINHHISFRRR